VWKKACWEQPFLGRSGVEHKQENILHRTVTLQQLELEINENREPDWAQFIGLNTHFRHHSRLQAKSPLSHFPFRPFSLSASPPPSAPPPHKPSIIMIPHSPLAPIPPRYTNLPHLRPRPFLLLSHPFILLLKRRPPPLLHKLHPPFPSREFFGSGNGDDG